MPRLLQRLSPVLALFFLAPLVGEFFLGDFPIVTIFLVAVFAPMYGGAALLIREFARRVGRGWPTIILLGLAYGVFEEGLVTQSLFNPHYLDQNLLDQGHGVLWLVYVVSLHTYWSVSVPVALVEEATPARRIRPWLGWKGLTVVAALFVVGSFAVYNTNLQLNHNWMASAPQRLGTVAAVLVLVVVAFLLPKRAPADEYGAVGERGAPGQRSAAHERGAPGQRSAAPECGAPGQHSAIHQCGAPSQHSAIHECGAPSQHSAIHECGATQERSPASGNRMTWDIGAAEETGATEQTSATEGNGGTGEGVGALSRGGVPSGWVTGAVALVGGLIFKAGLIMPVWSAAVAAFLVGPAIVLVLTARWSRRVGWGPEQRLGIAGGTLLTYSWAAFTAHSASFAIDLVSHVIYALAAVGLLYWVARKMRTPDVAPEVSEG
jgi:hypothetical protein